MQLKIVTLFVNETRNVSERALARGMVLLLLLHNYLSIFELLLLLLLLFIRFVERRKTNVMCFLLCVISNWVSRYASHPSVWFQLRFFRCRYSITRCCFISIRCIRLIQYVVAELCCFSFLLLLLLDVVRFNKIEWCKRFIFVNGEIHFPAAEHWRHQCAAFCNFHLTSISCAVEKRGERK